MGLIFELRLYMKEKVLKMMVRSYYYCKSGRTEFIASPSRGNIDLQIWGPRKPGSIVVLLIKTIVVCLTAITYHKQSFRGNTL